MRYDMKVVRFPRKVESEQKDVEGVQPVDYHKFDDQQWEKALRRGERIAWWLMIAPVIVTVVGLTAVTVILLIR